MGNPACGGGKVSSRQGFSYEQDIVDNVERAGCHITTVFDPDGVDPSFAYSVGFPQTVKQPDVIVFGLPHEIMSHMINAMLDQCRSVFRMADFKHVEGLLEGHHCVLRAVQSQFIVPDFFNSAMWFNLRQTGEEMTNAFQLVWPGAIDGLFPWEPGSSQEVREYQPALYGRHLNS
jgi:hypothetical protein